MLEPRYIHEGDEQRNEHVCAQVQEEIPIDLIEVERDKDDAGVCPYSVGNRDAKEDKKYPYFKTADIF